MLVDREFEKASEFVCTAGVRCLGWSADSRFLASGGEDLMVSVWDVLGETIVFTLPKVEDWLCSVGFTHDCKWLASCGFGSPSILLHPIEESEVELSEFEANAVNGPRRRASEAEIPVATAIVKIPAAPADSPSMQVPTNAQSFKTMGTVKAPLKDKGSAGPTSLSFNGAGATGTKIQVPGRNGDDRRPSRVVDMDEHIGFQLKVEQVKDREVGKGLLAKVDQRAAKAALMLGIKLTPAQMKPSEARQPVLFRHTDEVISLAFNPDGTRLLAGGEDRMLVVWDVASGDSSEASEAKIMEVKLGCAIICVAFGPSGKYVAAGLANSRVTACNAETKEELEAVRVDGDVLSVALSSGPRVEGDLLAVGTTEKKVLLITVPEMDEIVDLRHDGHVHSLSFSPDGFMLAGGGGTDDMHGLMTNKLEDRNMKTVVWSVSDNDENCKFLGSIAFRDIVHATAFSPSGKMLAAGGENRLIDLLLVDRDFDKATELQSAAGVRCLSWSADSRFLASGGEDMQISVWDIITEQVIFQLPKATDWYCSVAFSRDNMWLATCGFGVSECTLHPVDYIVEADDQEEEEDFPSESCGDQTPTGAGFHVTVASTTRASLVQELPLFGKRASLNAPSNHGELSKSTGTVKFTAGGSRNSSKGKASG
jgi:WD40 repeat protein